MNGVDLVILGIVGIAALIGLKSGILKPVSGIGGFILGIFLAIQNYSEVSVIMAQYIENPMAQRIAAFLAITFGVAIAVRLVGYLIKKLLSALVLGWLDHVVGMAGGAAVATAIVGTVFYVISGIGFAANSPAFSESKIAPEITRASLVTASSPWCSQLPEGAAESGQPCTSLMSFAGELVGMDFNKKVNEALAGQDVGTIVEVVKGSFKGQSPSQLAALAKQQTQQRVAEASDTQDIGTLADVVKDSLNSKSVADLAELAKQHAQQIAEGSDVQTPSEN